MVATTGNFDYDPPTMKPIQSLPTYEIHCVKYGERPGRRPEHFVGGDPHDAPMPMDYYVWLVRNEDCSVLVDTGFTAKMAIRGRVLLRTPAEGAGADWRQGRGDT